MAIKDKEARKKHFQDMEYLKLKDVDYLLRDLEELIHSDEYKHVKDEVSDIYDLIYERSKEVDEEVGKRFT
jgi:hypothetical protein